MKNKHLQIKQTLRNNFQVIRDELREHKNKAHVIKNNSQVLRNEEQSFRNNSQVIKGKLHNYRNEIKSLKYNFQVITDKLHKLENEADILRDNDKNNITLDKINNKKDLINKTDKILFKINIKVTNKVKYIYKAMHELQDEIYDEPWLRLVELNKINDILDGALNVASKEIYEKNKKSSIIINIDKYKYIDGYVSKLTDAVNNKIELINKIGETIDQVLQERNKERNITNEKKLKASEMDNDTLYLIDDNLDKITTQTRKKN